MRRAESLSDAFLRANGYFLDQPSKNASEGKIKSPESLSRDFLILTFSNYLFFGFLTGRNVSLRFAVRLCSILGYFRDNDFNATPI